MKSSRLLSLLLAVCLLFSLSSCSERENTGQQDPRPRRNGIVRRGHRCPAGGHRDGRACGQQGAGEAGERRAAANRPRGHPVPGRLHTGVACGARLWRVVCKQRDADRRCQPVLPRPLDHRRRRRQRFLQLVCGNRLPALFRRGAGGVVPRRRRQLGLPAEIYEADVRRYFDATTEQMRDNPDLYHADTNTYYALAGPGVGERPSPEIQSFTQEGDLVHIKLYLEGETERDRWMMLTIRLTDDGYRYVSYLPQSVNRAITDHLLEEIILKFGAEATRSEHVYHSTGTGMFLSPSWTVEEMTPGSFNGWVP